MNIIRLGTRFLNNSSPLTLLAAGAAIAVAFPPVRRGFRAVAVMTARGALAVADSVKDLGGKLKESTADIVAEARDYSGSPQDTLSETIDCIKDTVRHQGRRVAVATTAGALTLSDRARKIRRNFKDVVEEARTSRTDRNDTEEVRDDLAYENSEDSPYELLDTDLTPPHNRHKE